MGNLELLTLKYAFKTILRSIIEHEKFIRRSRPVLAELRVSLSLRLFWRQPKALYLFALDRYQTLLKIPGNLPETHFRPDAGSHRHSHIVPHVLGGIEFPHVTYEKFSSDRLGEPSAAIRARVQAACHIVPPG
jgi:hypothetical protein